MMTIPSRPEQRTLAILSSLSYRTGELSSYLYEVAQGVSELIGLDWSVVTYCQGDSERILASTIELGEAANQVYSLHGSLTGTVVKTGAPLVVENASTCKDYGQAPEGYQAYLGVPLRTSSGDVIGTICSFQRQPRCFTENEVKLAELFAERAATAIDNYQLYQQQQQFNEMLEAEVMKRTLELRAAQSELLTANLELEQRVEQRTAELKQAEAKFRAIVENANDIIFAITPDNVFSYVSPNVADVLGFQPSEMEGNLITSFIHPDDIQACIGEIEQLLSTGQKQSGTEYRAPHKQGGWRWLTANIGLTQDTNGQPLIVGVTRDISDRKQAEKALERLAEIGELAAMIVHEVRNPLTTISMGLNTFKRLNLTGRFQEYLALALDEADRLQRLLNQILLYSKPQTLQRSQLALDQLITETLDTLKTIPAASEKYLKVDIASAPIQVLADQDKLKQVFINLIINAYEASNTGETVTVKLYTLRNHQACIHIQNQGQPIPTESLPNLTKPFFTTKTAGTGLGLAIVKRIIEAHEGELSIESSATTGTIVQVLLPLTP
ncbi:GAF domain-containing sensor histidine kinase [Leptolyngbya sp. GGD]|uniref:GAF domain-containing sensor histidine kinase n=1 Tax=Leptolyngbya sp. GGD TaxID=2997907 RepID=UPI00227A6427|nr:GAF domain-containing sensor histidine kinase [Leptolyngbya sp. GGD]MCY6490455.1 PAS domain S-box protein [Leptolyngbya sp. GGD]